MAFVVVGRNESTSAATLPRSIMSCKHVLLPFCAQLIWHVCASCGFRKFRGSTSHDHSPVANAGRRASSMMLPLSRTRNVYRSEIIGSLGSLGTVTCGPQPLKRPLLRGPFWAPCHLVLTGRPPSCWSKAAGAATETTATGAAIGWL